ncbi:glycoside hydrolase family 3 N-terminal domain-containing protein [Kitasatospora sp. NBC_00315]|uniref:glycoside hydrolase family 3 N-terminal domain-containing protein n=1 Tax=Kitasatospora sp. NBC_00315 TaxID=2975963 RepID=UPI0032473671
MSLRTLGVSVSLVLLLAACSTAPAPTAGASATTPREPAVRSTSPQPPGTPTPSPPALSPLPGPTTGPTTGPSTGASPRPAAGASPGRSAEPTAEQLAGQRVVYSYRGPTPPEALFEDIRAGRAAGVIFFGENIPDTARLKAVVAQLREAQRQSPVQAPLLLMTDQEGGQIRRLPGEPVQSAKEVGLAADPDAAATRTGRAAGENLAGVGLNVNLAPVLDVYDTPGNFIDRTQRSYGKDPEAVASLGSAFVTAQQQAGVAATAKHFPGLGSAPAGSDTDTGPVTLPVALTVLRDVDEAPYSDAVAAGVDLVMLSWAVYPALDPDRPAGLSRTVVQQELRERLGFRGVTITDALEAGSLAAFGTPGQRAVAAAAAGMDLVLCSARDTVQGEQATTALADALDAGSLDRAEFTAAAARVTALREALG